MAFLEPWLESDLHVFGFTFPGWVVAAAILSAACLLAASKSRF
jgi:hypothetical protein